MEGKNIFIVTQETMTCIDTEYLTIAAFYNEEDTKKKMKEASENIIYYFGNDFPIDDIIVKENEHSFSIEIKYSDEYGKIEIKKTTLY